MPGPGSNERLTSWGKVRAGFVRRHNPSPIATARPVPRSLFGSARASCIANPFEIKIFTYKLLGLNILRDYT